MRDAQCVKETAETQRKANYFLIAQRPLRLGGRFLIRYSLHITRYSSHIHYKQIRIALSAREKIDTECCWLQY